MGQLCILGLGYLLLLSVLIGAVWFPSQHSILGCSRQQFLVVVSLPVRGVGTFSNVRGPDHVTSSHVIVDQLQRW